MFNNTQVRTSHLEELAAIQHDIWAHWMTYLFSQSKTLEDGSVLIPRDKAERWKCLINIDYDDLSEREKDSDREQVKKLPLWIPADHINIELLLPDGKLFHVSIDDDIITISDDKSIVGEATMPTAFRFCYEAKNV